MGINIDDYRGVRYVFRAYLTSSPQTSRGYNTNSIRISQRSLTEGHGGFPPARPLPDILKEFDEYRAKWVSPILTDMSTAQDTGQKMKAEEFRIVKICQPKGGSAGYYPGHYPGHPIIQTPTSNPASRYHPENRIVPMTFPIDLFETQPILQIRQEVLSSSVRVGDLVKAYEQGFHRVISIGKLGGLGCMTRPIKTQRILEHDFSLVRVPTNHTCDLTYCKPIREDSIELYSRTTSEKIGQLEQKLENLKSAVRNG